MLNLVKNKSCVLLYKYMKKVIWIIIIILLVVVYFYFKKPDNNIQNNQSLEQVNNIEAKAISLLEVETRNTKDSCWTNIGGKIYDLTKFISEHPGGADSIAKICGKDGTEIFGAKHGTNKMQQNILRGLYIGELAINE